MTTCRDRARSHQPKRPRTPHPVHRLTDGETGANPGYLGLVFLPSTTPHPPQSPSAQKIKEAPGWGGGHPGGWAPRRLFPFLPQLSPHC